MLAADPRPPRPGTDPAALRLGLDPQINLYSRDTAWFGLARWREMVAQFFDPPCPDDTAARIDSVSIRGRVAARRRSPRAWPSGWRRGWPASSAGGPRGIPIAPGTAWRRPSWAPRDPSPSRSSPRSIPRPSPLD